MANSGEIFEREPIQTRKKTASQQERRNSVSDIADFFQNKIADNSTPMSHTPKATRKMSGKKDKDKERRKEVREIKENIKNYLNTDMESPLQLRENANGETHSSGTSACLGDDHDTGELSVDNEPLINNSKMRNSATQTNEDEMLKAIQELANKYQEVDNTLNDPKNGMVKQLAKTNDKVSGLYTDIHGAVSGIKISLETVITRAAENSAKIEAMESTQKKIVALLDENKTLVDELRTMQGLLQKLSQNSKVTSEQVLDLTKRGMEQNIIIHGVDDTIETEDSSAQRPMYSSEKERCKYSALQFFKEVMKIDLEPEDIWKAHRTGPYKPDRVRALVLKVSYSAKDLIMEHVSSLKGLSNPKTKQVYFVSEQIPEGVLEKKKQTSQRVKILKDENEKKPKGERSKIAVVKDHILVDGQLDEPEVSTPQPSQILLLSKEHQSQIDSIQQKLQQTDPVFIQNSEFIALAIKVHSVQQVQQAYIAVAQRFASADHIMLGYALREEDKLKSGFCDDREFGAGNKIKKTIFETKTRNTAVFVVRKFGGLHLGYQRFRVIEDIAQKAINLL